MIQPEVPDHSHLIYNHGQTEMLLEVGTVGWDDDPDIFDLGTAGGPTFCKVNLFSGRDITKPIIATRAQGTPILTRVASNVFTLPPKGTEVLIAFPVDQQMKPGAGVIIATLGRVTQTATYGKLKEGELCIHPGSPDAKNRALFKANGNIAVFTQANGGSVAINVKASDGSIEMVTPYGAAVIKQAGVTVMHGSTSGLQLDDSGATLIGPAIGFNGGAVSLGAGALPAAVDGVAIKSGLAALLSALTTYVGAITTVLGTVSPPPTGLGAYTTAATAFLAAITAANIAGFSTSVSAAK